jgi:hypothetical protein
MAAQGAAYRFPGPTLRVADDATTGANSAPASSAFHILMQPSRYITLSLPQE